MSRAAAAQRRRDRCVPPGAVASSAQGCVVLCCVVCVVSCCVCSVVLCCVVCVVLCCVCCVLSCCVCVLSCCVCISVCLHISPSLPPSPSLSADCLAQGHAALALLRLARACTLLAGLPSAGEDRPCCCRHCRAGPCAQRAPSPPRPTHHWRRSQAVSNESRS